MSAPLPENIEDAYPLSPLQGGMLFHSINSPDTGVYVEQITQTIEQSDFKLAAFRKCWDLLIERHTAFRTAFVWKDLDIPLQVSVEGGRSRILVRELLQMQEGTLIELDKLAGEPLDLYVNSRLSARGEAVVVNDKFGLRLTDVVSPSERIENLG